MKVKVGIWFDGESDLWYIRPPIPINVANPFSQFKSLTQDVNEAMEFQAMSDDIEHKRLAAIEGLYAYYGHKNLDFSSAVHKDSNVVIISEPEFYW